MSASLRAESSLVQISRSEGEAMGVKSTTNWDAFMASPWPVKAGFELLTPLGNPSVCTLFTSEQWASLYPAELMFIQPSNQSSSIWPRPNFAILPLGGATILFNFSSYGSFLRVCKFARFAFLPKVKMVHNS